MADKNPQEKAPVEKAASAPAAPTGPAGASSAPPKAARRKLKRAVSRAVAFVKATFNNTHVTITGPGGEVIARGTAGVAGFKGTRKSTPFAAQRAAEIAASTASKMGVREVEVRVRGAGSGRESAIRALNNSGIKVLTIEDVTPLPHNGCRARKRRRV
jgi:small subunit ribosomal protein S11